MTDWLPVAASSYAGDMDRLIWFITAIVGVWFILAEAVLIFLIVRYRRRRRAHADYVAGRTRKQMAWILVPCVAILVCDLLIDGASARVWDRIKQTSPTPNLVIRVDGRQWSWEMTHPGRDGRLDTADDIKLPNEIHVPVNVIVQYELRSMDTLHSLWIPELRLKQDAVPGRTFRGWFEATRVGQYGVLCAELCGVAHGNMRGTLIVDDAGTYQSWLKSQEAGPASAPVASR